MKSKRRYDLDWIRVIVFALLIFYHVGMFFVPWSWHIKNSVTVKSLEIPMWFVNQWRLPVLFIISGMGTRFALSKRSWKQYVTERYRRLLIPLLAGILIVVAPQVYIERLADGAVHTSFWDFYPRFFEGIYPTGNFSWHHLWFLPYLFTFSILLTPLFIHVRNNPEGRFMQALQNLLQYPFGLPALLLPLLMVTLFLKPFFPVTHNLVYDWYAFARYLLLFLYGFLFISAGSVFWGRLDQIKTKALAVGLVSFLLMVLIDSSLPDDTFRHLVLSLLGTVNLGAWSAVIFGYGAALLNRPSRKLTYCNQAVYPFYIAHQTITIVAGYYIIDIDWPVAWKFSYLLLVTIVGSWIFFEAAKRFSPTRRIFGIKEVNKSG